MTDVESKRRIAYFTMEIAIDDSIPSYSGGLGVLAGDLMLSFERLAIPCVCITLLYGRGYASHDNNNDVFDPSKTGMSNLQVNANLEIGSDTLSLSAWSYKVGRYVDILFIKADSNDPNFAHLTDFLYDPSEYIRLRQEMMLGIGGVRILKALGYSPAVYHMNESHSAFLVVELLKDMNEKEVLDRCVMTTHTPISAAHERYSIASLKEAFQKYDWMDWNKFSDGKEINMSLFAARHCRAVNAVSMKHKYVSRDLFPGQKLLHITNGINHLRWVHAAWCEVFDSYLSGWRDEPSLLRQAFNIPSEAVIKAHAAAKDQLLNYVMSRTGIQLDKGMITIAIARRMTGYKRNNLILRDVDRLENIASEVGGMQLLFAGKAHANDESGRAVLDDIKAKASGKGNLRIVFLDNYGLDAAKLLTAGSDVWLNTPKAPLEASGTSGMKAALNGVLNLSVWDGWWLEGGIEGVNGWGIGERKDWQDLSSSDDETDYNALIAKLSNAVLPAFYKDEQRWLNMMKSSIATVAPYFNTDRVVKEYVSKMYTNL
ncbi:MAG: alpha-glucan family phosphorylase [Conexivisphaerales archaeon]